MRYVTLPVGAVYGVNGRNGGIQFSQLGPQGIEEFVQRYSFPVSHIGMSERLGKSRASITNYMRLLKLPAQIQMALKNRDIDMGHARALLSLDSPSQQLKVFKDVHRNGYSVRKVEEMVQRVKKGEPLQEVRKFISPNQLPLEYSILRDRLSELFKTKVTMTCSPEVKGKISINFSNEDELEFIMQAFDKVKKSQK